MYINKEVIYAVITETLMNGFKVVFMWIINLIPSPEQATELNIVEVANMFIEIIQGVAYVLPVSDILIMLGIWYGLYTFFIGWKAIQLIRVAFPNT